MVKNDKEKKIKKPLALSESGLYTRNNQRRYQAMKPDNKIKKYLADIGRKGGSARGERKAEGAKKAWVTRKKKGKNNV